MIVFGILMNESQFLDTLFTTKELAQASLEETHSKFDEPTRSQLMGRFKIIEVPVHSMVQHL